MTRPAPTLPTCGGARVRSSSARAGPLRLVGLAVLLLSGCATHRDRESDPEALTQIAARPGWVHALPASVQSRSNRWWTLYGDTDLNAHVERARRTSPDLAVLVRRVELARAEAGLLAAGANPAADASVGIRAGEERNRETDFRTESLMPVTGAAALSWELDLLGKWRQRRRAGTSRVDATRSEWLGGQLLLTAEVVAAWIGLIEGKEATEILARSLANRERVLEIQRGLAKAGLADTATIDRQLAAALEVEQELSDARIRAEKAAVRLDRLVGGAEGFPVAPAGSLRERISLPPPPDFLPMDVLRVRPDLLAAEQRVREAFHLSRAARLDLFPTLELRLGGSTMTGSLTDPLRSWAAEIGPRLEIPIWDPDRIAARRVAGARLQVTAAEYRAAVFRAFEEVERALIDHRRLDERYRQAESISARVESTRRITEEKLAAGLVSEIDALEDEFRALEARRRSIDAYARLLSASVQLIRAQGGA